MIADWSKLMTVLLRAAFTCILFVHCSRMIYQSIYVHGSTLK
jgi:hypothetical protein